MRDEERLAEQARGAEVGDLYVDVVVTVSGQPDLTCPGLTQKNTRVERYVPQSFVIEQAAIVVSHGGAGTLIGAASAGKRQLCQTNETSTRSAAPSNTF